MKHIPPFFIRKSFLIISFLLIYATVSLAQMQAIADKVLSVQAGDKLSDKDKEEMDEFWKLIKFLRAQEENEKALNGKGAFGIQGDETSNASLFVVSGGIGIDKGNYPYELDFSTNIQTVFRNGGLQENLSDIDISYDYHHQKVGDGLFLENYTFLNRFSDAYLGVQQKYQVGGGIILNHYFEALTENGIKAKEKLDRKPKYSTDGEGNLIKCFQESCEKIGNPKKLSEAEIEQIENAQERYSKAIHKNYSKLRLAMLVGILYELEKVSAADSVYFTSGTQYRSESFDATNQMRMELRPKITYQPNDIFTLKFHVFYKLPMLWEWKEKVVYNDLVDARADYFVDMQTSFSAKFTEGASFSFRYRYLYDNAPRRTFVTDASGEPQLLRANKRHHNFGFSFNFKF